ncbi:hypothetical protein EVAR_43114_1 [Eumeta japonica]|uniref:Uncharacterized protein n=1 Tax=Eumeta variegata TaxID=151549 RepID=A0A4C1YJL2_EUMVA|nr:hypothetical protein EVAR_43114_1 [Eumeta japonica]
MPELKTIQRKRRSFPTQREKNDKVKKPISVCRRRGEEIASRRYQLIYDYSAKAEFTNGFRITCLRNGGSGLPFFMKKKKKIQKTVYISHLEYLSEKEKTLVCNNPSSRLPNKIGKLKLQLTGYTSDRTGEKQSSGDHDPKVVAYTGSR